MRFRPAFVLPAVVLLTVSKARAETEQDEWDGGYGERAERRSGFTAGLGTGLAFGKARGYPNVAGQIGDPSYRSETGFALGQDLTVWFGGALKDWFVFAIAADSVAIGGNDLVAGGWAFLFRVETYPLFYEGGIWRDLGVQASFGIGAGVILDADEEVVADGGALSIAGLGATYEAFRFGYFAAGPTLEYRYQFSQSIKEHLGVLAMRIVFYGGP